MRRIDLSLDKESLEQEMIGYTGRAIVECDGYLHVEKGRIRLPQYTEVYYKDGKIHNDKGAAIILVAQQGYDVFEFKYYVEEGMFVKKNKSFEIFKNKERVEIAIFNSSGKPHCITGYATYSKRNNEETRQYAVDGKFLAEKDFNHHPKVVNYKKKQLKDKINKLGE